MLITTKVLSGRRRGDAVPAYPIKLLYNKIELFVFENKRVMEETTPVPSLKKAGNSTDAAARQVRTHVTNAADYRRGA